MRPAHHITSCTYSTMALRISYASTNLPARGPTSRIYPLVVQPLWTSPLIV